MRKAILVLSVVFALGAAGLLQVAGAAKGGEEKPHQYVVVCHRTGSASNPFVVIAVAEDSTQLGVQPNGGGHKENGAPPGHEDDIFVLWTTDHKEALELAKQGPDICVQAEEIPPAPPAPGQEGAAPVTG